MRVDTRQRRFIVGKPACFRQKKQKPGVAQNIYIYTSKFLLLVQFVKNVVGVFNKTRAFRSWPKQHTLVRGPVVPFVVSQVETMAVCPAFMVADHARFHQLGGEG